MERTTIFRVLAFKAYIQIELAQIPNKYKQKYYIKC